jgi:hypothetical protein
MTIRDKAWWDSVKEIHAFLAKDLHLPEPRYTFEDGADFRMLLIDDLVLDWVKPNECQVEKLLLERWHAVPATRWEPPDGDYYVIKGLSMDLSPEKAAVIVVQTQVGIRIDNALEAYGLERYYKEMDTATR